MLNKKITLVLFCKKPKLQQGKQRLAAEISAKATLQVAEALLNCAVEDAKNWQGPIVIACSDTNDLLWAQALLPNAQVVPQINHENKVSNLGQRINYVDKNLRDLGHESIIYIGTDAPILNQTIYHSIIAALEENDVALSHADDGGVIAMASNKPWPDLASLPWSTDLLSQALRDLCQAQQLTVKYAESGYDIDYVADLKKLFIDLKSDVRPARKALLKTLIELPIFSGEILNA